MPVPFLLPALALGLGLGGAAYVIRQKREHLPVLPFWVSVPSLGREPRFTGRLERGQAYRVWAKISRAYSDGLGAGAAQGHAQEQIEDALKNDLASVGFAPKLATQDPTDPERWSFLATWASVSHETYDPRAPEFVLTDLDDVQGFDTLGLEGSREQTEVSNLDAGLSVDELEALRFALAKDHDPRRLEGFARTFDGEFPIAASYLHAKSKLEDIARATNRGPGDSDIGISGMRQDMRDARAERFTSDEAQALFGKMTYAKLRQHGRTPTQAALESAKLLALRARALVSGGGHGGGHGGGRGGGHGGAHHGGKGAWGPGGGWGWGPWYADDALLLLPGDEGECAPGERRVLPNGQAWDCSPAHAWVRTGWFGEDIANAVEDVGSSVVDKLKEATDDLGVSDIWDKFGGAVETLGGWVPGPQIWLVELGVKMAKSIEQGHYAAEDLGHVFLGQSIRFLDGLRKTSPFLKLVPGLGAGIATAIDAAASVALWAATCADTPDQCPPLDDEAVATLGRAALDNLPFELDPGTLAIAKEGYDLGVKYGGAFGRGETFDEIALKELRSRMGPEAQIMLDAGVALARGKDLADAGFRAFAQYAISSAEDEVQALAEKGRDFASTMLESVARNVPMQQVFIEKLGAAAAAVPAEIREPAFASAVAFLQEDTERLKQMPAQLAATLDIPTIVANAALAAVQDLGNGLVRVDPSVATSIMTKGLRNLTPVPRSALTSAFAQIRPRTSMIAETPVLAQRLTLIRQLNDGGDASGEAAQNALDRAQRLLDRRNWVAWYQRLAAIGAMP